MIDLRYEKCSKECKLFLNHGSNHCIYDYHVFGTNKVVPAPEGETCPHYKEEIPEKPYALMTNFDLISQRQAAEAALELKVKKQPIQLPAPVDVADMKKTG